MATATADQAQQVVPALPFTSAAHTHVEPGPVFTVTPSTAVQQLNPIDVPAYGYLRHVVVDVVGAGGVGGTGNADFPWNVIQSVTLQDVNGANIFGPLDGYALYIANLVGGYAFNNNPANLPTFVGTAPNLAFTLRVPVEISEKDALGALANQNAAANYKLTIAINSIAATTSVAYTTPPVLTVRTFLEAWTLPAPVDNRGRPQAQVPPLLGTGQYWSGTTRSTLAGANTLAVTRVGNYIRAIALIGRDGSNVRQNACLPDPMQFNWDGNQIDNASFRYFQNILFERISGAVTFPAGVVVLPFNYGGGSGGRFGNEDPNLWLPTSQSSRLEFVGTVVTAGTVQMLVNEVAPIETAQADRFQTPSASGTLAQPNH